MITDSVPGTFLGGVTAAVNKAGKAPALPNMREIWWVGPNNDLDSSPGSILEEEAFQLRPKVSPNDARRWVRQFYL